MKGDIKMADNVKFQCSSCGTPAPEGSKFCTVCGSPVIAVQAEEPVAAPADETVAYDAYSNEPQEANENEAYNENATEGAENTEQTVDSGFYYQNPEAAAPAKKQNFFKKHLKLICIIGIAAILIAAAIVACVLIFGGSSQYVEPTNDIMVLYKKSDDVTYIVDGDSVYEKTIDGKAYLRLTSVDGEVALIMDEEDTLYIFDGKLEKIVDDVGGGILSDNGSSVVYVDKEDVLFFYDGGESKEILDDASKVTDAVISPDGKCVVYVDNGDLNLYDGDTEKLVEDVKRVYGVSNGAKLIYYMDENDSLRVLKGDEDIKLGKGSFLYFNSDRTQVIFTSGDNGENCYISENGGEKVRFSKTGISSASLYQLALYGKIVNRSLPVKNFGDMYFLDNENTLWYVDGDFVATEVEKDVVGYYIAKNNSKVVYYHNDKDKLYRGEGPDSEFTCIGKDVARYYVTTDGDACYYVDRDATLFYVDGEGDAVEIAKDLDGVDMTHDNYVIFKEEDDDKRYYTYNGSEKKEIDVIPDGDFMLDLDTKFANTYLYIFDKDEDTGYAYVATKGVDFKLIMDDLKEEDFNK